MARITPVQQEVMVVVDRWVRDTWERESVDAKTPKYLTLIESLAVLLQKRDQEHGKVFDQAVEAAYQKGLAAGRKGGK